MRNALATAMFEAWWTPLSRFGVIHGDPHLGNYTVFARDGAPAGINLLDFGCIRIFPPSFVGGVVDLYRALIDGDDDSSSTPTSLGLPAAHPRSDRDAQHLGALHLRPAARRSRAHHGRRREAAAYGRREAFQVHRRSSERPGHDPARIRLHGPRRHRPRRRVPAPGRRTQLAPTVQRGDGGVLDEALAKRQAEALAAAGLAETH